MRDNVLRTYDSACGTGERIGVVSCPFGFGVPSSQVAMAQYEMSVYLYAYNKDNDGIAIVVHRTPAAPGHLEIGAGAAHARKFHSASTEIYIGHSVHTFTIRTTLGDASRGAFAATVIDNFARGLNAIVKSINFERAEYATATLCDNSKVHHPGASVPFKPIKHEDDPRGSFIAPPMLLFGFGHLYDRRTKWQHVAAFWRKEYELRCGLKHLLHVFYEIHFRPGQPGALEAENHFQQITKKMRTD